MRYDTLPFDSREFVRRFRQNYINYYKLWTKVERAVPDEMELLSPRGAPITEEDLPEQLRSLLAAYRKSHPEEDISFVKRMRTGMLSQSGS